MLVDLKPPASLSFTALRQSCAEPQSKKRHPPRNVAVQSSYYLFGFNVFSRSAPTSAFPVQLQRLRSVGCEHALRVRAFQSVLTRLEEACRVETDSLLALEVSYTLLE